MVLILIYFVKEQKLFMEKMLFMDKVVRSLKHVFTYVDDVLVFS